MQGQLSLPVDLTEQKQKEMINSEVQQEGVNDSLPQASSRLVLANSAFSS